MKLNILQALKAVLLQVKAYVDKNKFSGSYTDLSDTPDLSLVENIMPMEEAVNYFEDVFYTSNKAMTIYLNATENVDWVTFFIPANGVIAVRLHNNITDKDVLIATGSAAIADFSLFSISVNATDKVIYARDYGRCSVTQVYYDENGVIDETRNRTRTYGFYTNVLNMNNNIKYTPTGDYNPATKKYVDDNVNTKLSSPEDAGAEGQVLSLDDSGNTIWTDLPKKEYIELTLGTKDNPLILSDALGYSGSAIDVLLKLQGPNGINIGYMKVNNEATYTQVFMVDSCTYYMATLAVVDPSGIQKCYGVLYVSGNYPIYLSFNNTELITSSTYALNNSVVKIAQGSNNANKILTTDESGNVTLSTTDESLSVDGIPADAKATGEKITELSEKIDNLNNVDFHFCAANEVFSDGTPNVADPQEKVIYFVPNNGETPNIYDEYVWHGDGWEYFGSASVDMSEYVKFTNYATTNKAGVVKINSSDDTAYMYGVLLDNSNVLKLYAGSNSLFASKNKNANTAILPSHIDFISVQSAHQEMSDTYDPDTALTPDGNVPYAYGGRQPVSYTAVKNYIDSQNDWKNTPVLEIETTEEVAYIAQQFDTEYEEIFIIIFGITQDSSSATLRIYTSNVTPGITNVNTHVFNTFSYGSSSGGMYNYFSIGKFNNNYSVVNCSNQGHGLSETQPITEKTMLLETKNITGISFVSGSVLLPGTKVIVYGKPISEVMAE